MPMISRRNFLKWLGRATVGGLVAGTYGVWIEPQYLLRTTVHAFIPPGWTPGLKLRIVMLADPHLIKPHMSLDRWKRIIEAANHLQPDMHLLMGDYLASHPFNTGRETFEDAAAAATQLQSPLGTYSVLGNHDWWEDKELQRTQQGVPHAQNVFTAAGIPVLDNRAVKIIKNDKHFWLAGTQSMVAIRKGRRRFESRADVKASHAAITDEAPLIHLAHEPDLFVELPERVSLTLSGHTHGGQVRLFGYSPVVPSQFGNRFAYGHIIEAGRHLVVSGGLGCSLLPIRIGSPPEITVLELG